MEKVGEERTEGGGQRWRWRKWERRKRRTDSVFLKSTHIHI